MSAQSGKKKRLGSRRRGGNQSERSEPDEFHVKDSTSVAQANISEENTESLNVLSNPDYSQLETKHPPSPELTGNRRKLGSSRRSKGRQYVKDSVTEPYNKPREEVEENTSNETLEPTQMSLTIQPERQTELSQGNEHDIFYVTHDSSLYSVTMPGYSEVHNPSSSEVDLESLIAKNENLQAEHDQTETDCKVVSDSCKIMLGGTNKSDTLESAEVSDQVGQNAHHFGTSEFNSSSLHLSPTVDQQLIDQSKSSEMPGELPSVDSVTDTENKKIDDTDLLRQDGNLQGNYLVSESYVKSEDIEFSTTPETTTDKSSLWENTEIEYKQATFSLPTEELSTNEELNEHFNLSEVRNDQHSEDAVNKVLVQEVKPTQMQEMHQIYYTSESVIHDATEKSDNCSENPIEQAEIRDTYQSELNSKNTDNVVKQEVSDPDDKQDEHPIKEHNMGALNQKNEDEHVSNTKEPWISNIAPCQVYVGESQVEDNIKPSAEQTVHQEREELLYKVEERESYLQNLQSEINAPLDSQPQGDSVSAEEQTDSSFNSVGNRRKMGFSRRNKGRQHIKDPVAESYHKPTEEVVENMRGSEAFETTKMSLATEPIWQEELSQETDSEMTHDNSLYSTTTPGYSSEVQNLTTTNHPETVLEGLIPRSENLQADDEREADCTVVSDVCESVETTLEERDKSDTPQTEDISDQVKETSHLVGISALTSISVHSSSTVDQQLNDRSNSRETSNEELPSDYSVTDVENKERDDDTNLLRQDGILQVNYLTCESHVESEDVKFSTTPEVTTDKTSFRENTEIEYSVEEEPFSLPTEELSTNEELNEQFNLSEVIDTQHSEDPVNKEHKQEVKATQMQEMHQIDYSSENVIHDATEKSDTCSENLIDQAEIRDTYQSELSLKSTDDFATKQEVSNPDDKHDEHPIEESNMGALNQKNEDDHVSNTKEPWISNIAPCQVHEGVDQVEDGIQPSAEQTVHQVKEGILSEFEEGKSSLPNLQSEINAPLDSQPQDDSMSIEEQTDTSFKPIGNRRKMGSSRRSKGRRHIKDPVAESYREPTEEVVENMRGSEAFETTEMSLATEPIWQEELSQETEPEMTHDNSLYSATTPGYSSEVQNLTTTNHPETVLEGLIPRSENLQADDDERGTECTVVSDVCESVETTLEERDKSDTPQTEDISDQVKETSHLVGISALTSISVHSSSTVDQQLNDRSYSREMSNEELPSVYSVTDTENKEKDDDTNLLRQDGILQVNYLTCESHVESEDVKFSTTSEVTIAKTRFGENTEIEYNIEQATFSLPTEELSTNEELNEQLNLSEVKDTQHSEDAVNKEHKQEVRASQMQEMHQIDYSSGSVIHDATEKSDTCSENLIDQAEIRDTYQSELSLKSTDDFATKQEVSNPDDKHDEHPIEESNMGALNQKTEDDHVSNTKEPWISNIAPCQVHEGVDQVEDGIQPSAEETVHQVKEGILSEFEEGKSSLPNLQSEINALLDSQPQDDSVSIEEQTDTSFKPIGNRRKMGSSRRSKGRRHIKDPVAESYREPTEEVVENMRGSEAFETTEMSLATEPIWQEELNQETEPEMTHDNSLYSATTPGYSSEVQNLTTTNHPETVLEGLIPRIENLQADDDERETDCTVVSDVCESVETTLEERDKSDTPQTEDISDQVKETSHLVGISALTSISVHSSSTVDQQLNDRSYSREMSNEELPSVYSVTDTENKEKDDDTNLLRQDGILQVNYLTCESHVESENVKFSTTSEVTIAKTSFGENTEIEYNIERATFSLPTEELSTNEELNEQLNLSEVKDDQHSEDAVNKEHKQEVRESQMQEMHQIDYSSGSVIHDATEKSDTCSENLIDQAEIRDTYQSELSLKSTDDFATKQEVSNPDDKHDEHPIEESNMGALNQKNEDDHVSNTKEPWISNIAPCQVHEGVDQVEDGIQPSAEETIHQVKEGILSEFEEGKSSLPNLQSEINAPLDSQPQDDSVSIEEQTDTSFKPIGNRRKMGSSRRSKGRRHIKDPVAESYREPTEEVVENMRGSEAFETTEMSLATEPIWQEELSQETEPEMTHDNSLYSATTPGYSSEVQNLTTTNHPETVLEGLIPRSENLQADDDERETDCTVVSDICESVETTLEERDKSDTPQTEDISDQVKETSHLVGISALTSISVHSSSTVDQQLNDRSYSREMSNEELPSVYSVTDTENKEKDDDTNLLRQDGILQVNYLTCESHVESENVKFSTTSEVTIAKTSFGENTEIEYNIEQATFSLPTEELSTNEELNEQLNLSEVKDDQHSEDAVNKEHKQEVRESQMQEMHQIDYSSGSVIHDATEKSDTCSENLIDQAEIRDTYQSELSLKSTDDFATKQEVSNPDDKHDEHPIEESNMGALNQKNEDDHVSNTKEPWISNIAPCQVHEGVDQVEDGIQPSAEETIHQVKEGILSEFEEGKSSLPNLQSEINAPLDSQPQDDSVSIEEQTDTSFKPIGNRRKMGSSRRSKGRRHIKDPVAESYREPTEEVVENMRGSEAFETTEMSLATEPIWQEELSQETEPEMTHDNSLYSATTPGYSSEVQNLTTTNHPETVLEGLSPRSENLQADDDERETDCTVVSDVCESVETTLEERDKSDTPQTEDISDQVKETSHLVGISALTSISVHSSSTVDQQLNDRSNSRETSNEELPSDYSVTDVENKERDDDTNLLRQDGILQVNYLTCESHVESEDVEFSTTPEVTTDKTSFRENTEIEYSVEEEPFSLPTEELSTNEELNEQFNLSEVIDTQHSEDPVNKEHKQEVKATQMQEMHQIDYSSENVIHDATKNSDTCSENLIDQAEIRDTYQSELSLKSTDDFATKQEVSNPDDKHDEHPIEESNMGALNQKNEDDHVSNTKEPWISNIAPCQVHEGVDQVEDGIQPSAEETVHQVKEGILSEFEEDKSSLPNLQSEINAPLDSQPQDDSVSIEEQTDTSFKPIGNRRKMGSSRRSKGRRHIKDPVAESYREPTEEVVENMRGSEAFETTEMSLATEPIWQEELSQKTEPEMTHDNSLYSATTPGYSSEVQNLTTTNHPETVLEGLIPRSENLQADDDERETDCTVVSDVCESVETTLEERDKSDTPQTEDISDQVKETSHLVGISALTSISVHSSSTVDQQLNDRSYSREMSNVDQVEDGIQPSAEETVHQVKEGIFSEFEEGKSSLQTQLSKINAPLDSQPQDDSMSIEEQTDTSFKPIGNRRKMGSSRRNKGRQHIKDPVAESYPEPTEGVVGNTRDNEVIEAMKRSLIIEAPVEEKSVETMLDEMDKLDTSQTDKVSDQVKENAQEMPNEELPDVYSVTYTENKQRDEDTELLVQHGNLQGDYLVSESHVKSAKYHENTEIVYSVEKATISSANGRLSTNEEQNEHFILAEVRDAQHSEDTVNKVHEQEDKPTQMHEMDQTDYSSVKEGKSLHTLQSGTHSPLGSLPQDDSVSIKEQTHTGINPTVNRRKMGSSRRHKGRQPVKDSVAVSDMEPKDEVIENVWGDEAFETMKMSLATETTTQEEFREQIDPGLKPAEDIRMCSTVNEEDNTQNMREEDTILSENVKDDSVKSNEEVNENADDAHKSQQGTQENSDCSENLQIKSQQRRRKLASNRRDLIRKQKKERDNKDETEESDLHLDTVEKVAEIPMVVTTDLSQNEKAKLSLSTVHEEQEINEASSSTSDLHSTESNIISGLDDLMALLPEESASFSEEVVNAIKSFQVPEIDLGDRNVVVSVEKPPVDDDRSTETFCGTTQRDEKGPKDIKVIQGQDTNEQEALKQTTEAPGVALADLEIVKSAIRGGAEEEHKNVQADIQEPKDVNEGAHNTNSEMKNSSPNVNLTNRRKKLGSSRRNQKEVDNEATETNVGDVMTEHVSDIKEKELQLQKEHKDGDSEPGKEKVFETVQYSHTGDSYTEPPGHQTVEENPAVSGQLVETEHHLTPDDIPVKLATSPKHDMMSESAYEGKRRKLGSHRKSHGHQTAREDRIIEAETGRDVKTITDESGIKTLEENREESEVIESDKKPSSNISISKTGEPVSEKISVQHHYAEVRLGRDSQKGLSLADNYIGANRYNVVMIGDSSVGKTSFMRRAQSGKFSFDLPASVGLDSCLWNVVVDGKPVVLQLWDTAGQERFHSITRQIFHKAQAFLLMYDITSSQSFSAVRYWADCIMNGAVDDVAVILLGNKSDCAKRQVPTRQGESLAKEYNYDFMECSAATGENVVRSLEIVARLLSQNVDTTKETVVLHKEPQQKKTSGCC